MAFSFIIKWIYAYLLKKTKYVLIQNISKYIYKNISLIKYIFVRLLYFGYSHI